MEKQKATKKPVDLTFEWDGEPNKIVYNRRAITYNSMKDAAEMSQAGVDDSELEQGVRNVGFLIKQLKRFVLEWDLTDKGKPVPITEQEMGSFDPDFLAAMFDAIMEDIRPPNSPRSGESAGNSSAVKASEESLTTASS